MLPVNYLCFNKASFLCQSHFMEITRLSQSWGKSGLPPLFGGITRFKTVSFFIVFAMSQLFLLDMLKPITTKDTLDTESFSKKLTGLLCLLLLICLTHSILLAQGRIVVCWHHDLPPIYWRYPTSGFAPCFSSVIHPLALCRSNSLPDAFQL